MWSIHLFDGRVPVAISPHSPDIDIESVPVEPYLLFGALGKGQVLAVQRLDDKPKSVGIGIGKEKAAVVEEHFHQRFDQWKDHHEELPSN